MILSVSLNPCLETFVEVDSLAVGKTNKVISKRIFMTGNALNVATGIARLEGDSFATGFMFEGNGRQFEQGLHKEGVTYKFVWKQGRVKEDYKFIDSRSMLTEVVEEATPLTIQDGEELKSLFTEICPKCDTVVFSGECPEGLGKDYLPQLLKEVPKGILKIVDTNAENLIKAVECGVDLAKPNLSELQSALHTKITDLSTMKRACKSLYEMGAKRVLLSLGKSGAVIYDGDRTLFCTSLNVAINSTAGAGDAMVASATKALSEGADCEEILKCGVAAGAASVTLPDSISFNKSKYEEILSIMSVKEI
ncbi:MAG: 1-phosphofructokinase family hexose kinase [Candidatus Coproplasma sp.]